MVYNRNPDANIIERERYKYQNKKKQTKELKKECIMDYGNMGCVWKMPISLLSTRHDCINQTKENDFEEGQESKGFFL